MRCGPARNGRFELSFGVAKSASLRQALEYLVSDDFANAFDGHG